MSKRKSNKSKYRKPVEKSVEQKPKVVKTTSKVVKTTSSSKSTSKKSTAARTRAKSSRATAKKDKLYTSKDMMFGRQNYILMAAGLGLIIIGFFLMVGGEQPSPDVWNAEEIYSFRRTVLAPFVVLVGLVVEIVAIFKTDKSAENTEIAEL